MCGVEDVLTYWTVPASLRFELDHSYPEHLSPWVGRERQDCKVVIKVKLEEQPEHVNSNL